MCGICGIINFDHQKADQAELNLMMREMKHRGPDDEGMWCEDNTGLGFVRLSIIDLSPLGHQPMIDPTGRYILVFNGEIYNYIELREILQKKGYKFRSATDTEVLLYAYMEWGEACLDQLNGMWAFAIYDKEKHKLFAARDRFGIKPFYYCCNPKQFVFASDITPIRKILKNLISIDDSSVYDYLVYNRTDQSEKTFFTQIKKLPHACKLVIENNVCTITHWYNLSEKLNNPFHGFDEYRSLLSDSIGLQLRSDVPVGICFSGGLDSSSIASVLLKDYNKTDLHTFSAVFGDHFNDDELKYIKIFSKSLSNMHYTEPSAETFFNDITDFLKAHSEPVPTTSPYAQYKVMQLAQGHATVLLDGQGADEQLGGYHYFFGFYFKELLRTGRIMRLLKEMAAYGINHKSSYAYKTLIYFLMSPDSKVIFSEGERNYIRSGFLNSFRGDEIIENLYESKDLNTALLNHFEYKLEHLLKWEDHNSMWFSIEARVPFLDHRVVEQTLSLPSYSIIRNGTTKHYLRNAMRGYLPEEIRKRQSKIGFITPDNQWFRSSSFYNYITDMLHSEHFRNNQYIDYKIAGKMYLQHLSGKENFSRDIWKWINLDHLLHQLTSS